MLFYCCNNWTEQRTLFKQEILADSVKLSTAQTFRSICITASTILFLFFLFVFVCCFFWFFWLGSTKIQTQERKSTLKGGNEAVVMQLRLQTPIRYHIQSCNCIGCYGIRPRKSRIAHDDILPSRTTESDSGSWPIGVEHGRCSQCVSWKKDSTYFFFLTFFFFSLGEGGVGCAGVGVGGTTSQKDMTQTM